MPDLDALFREFHQPLVRYLTRRLGDRDWAEEVAQETFLRAARQEEIVSERAWLFAVATNLVRDEARKDARRRRHLEVLAREVRAEEEEAQAPQQLTLERAEDAAAARRALESLSERDREALLMREEGLDYGEIAAALSLSVGSVGTTLSRARRRLVEAYEEHERHLKNAKGGVMQHPDEGIIHAWADGALIGDEARAIESHIATCATCAAAVAEARGLIAASSRIVSSLDVVPGQVLPAFGAKQRAWFRSPAVLAAIAASVIVVVGTTMTLRSGDGAKSLASNAVAGADSGAIPTPAVTSVMSPAGPAAAPAVSQVAMAPRSRQPAVTASAAETKAADRREGPAGGVAGAAAALARAEQVAVRADSVRLNVTPSTGVATIATESLGQGARPVNLATLPVAGVASSTPPQAKVSGVSILRADSLMTKRVAADSASRVATTIVADRALDTQGNARRADSTQVAQLNRAPAAAAPPSASTTVASAANAAALGAAAAGGRGGRGGGGGGGRGGGRAFAPTPAQLDSLVRTFVACYELDQSVDILPRRFALAGDTVTAAPIAFAVRYVDSTGTISVPIADASWTPNAANRVTIAGAGSPGRRTLLVLVRVDTVLTASTTAAVPFGPRPIRRLPCR